MSEAAERWLVFAREDLQMADLALRENIYTQACFHAQQCAEKALKSALAHRFPQSPPRTHAMADLLRLLPADDFANIRAQLLESMDDYFLPTRYPDAVPGTLPDGLPGRLDAEEAVGLARVALAEAEQLLKAAEG